AAQQAIERHETHFIIGLIAGAGAMLHFRVHEVVGVMVAIDQLARGRGVTGVAGHMKSDRQVAEDAEGIQPAFGPPERVLVEELGPENGPARRLSVVIDQHELVRKQMVGNVADDFAQAFALRLVVGAKIVVKRVEEIMAVELVAAGVRFPKPFAIGAAGPAWLVDLPELIGFVRAAVLLQPAGIGVGPVCRANGSRDITFGRGGIAALGYFLKKAQGLKSLFGAFLGLGIFGGGIGK